jgi:hypothetical protein
MPEGTLASAGKPADAYDPARQHAAEVRHTFFSRGIMSATDIPPGLFVMPGFYTATLRRAAMDRSQSTVPAGRVAQA